MTQGAETLARPVNDPFDDKYNMVEDEVQDKAG